MKKYIFLFFILISCAASAINEQTIAIGEQKILVHFEITEGRFNGMYKSYYGNGQPRAAGTFENNNRKGIWSVWDSAGILKMKRDYSDPFTFTRLVPDYPDDPAIRLLGGQVYKVTRNIDGMIELPFVRERAIVEQAYLRRFVTAENNPVLFSNGLLEDIVFHYATIDSLFLYRNYDFTKITVSWKDLDTTNTSLIGFKIIEDWILENERLVSEYRIMGICPVVYNHVTNDTTDLFCAYFPSLRPFLADYDLSSLGLPTHITSVDDLFFYRYFSGHVFGFKEPHNYEPKISAYIELNYIPDLTLIEKEHAMWLDYTSE